MAWKFHLIQTDESVHEGIKVEIDASDHVALYSTPSGPPTTFQPDEVEVILMREV